MNEHIIFVISALHGGGAERVIATLANYYAKEQIRVTILMVAGTESVYPLDRNVELLSIGEPSMGNPIVQIKRIFAMRQYFKKYKESVIVAFGTSINLFVILAALGLRNKVIVSERNDPEQCRYKPLRNLIYAFGRHFVFQTEDAKKCFPVRIQHNGTVIPNPIRKDLPEAYHGVRDKKIAAVGRLEPQKNHKLLLEAFADFAKVFPEYELHIFGKGRLEQELKEYACSLGIDARVVFEGFRKDVLEVIKSYTMYVLSSDYEGISNSLMEAMAVGLPCISTDCPIGGSAMCIQNGVNGLLAPMRDKEALCKAMMRIAKDPQMAYDMGGNAAQIRDTFSEEKIADMWREYMGL